MMQGKIHLKIARYFLSFNLFLHNRCIAIRMAVHSIRNSTHLKLKKKNTCLCHWNMLRLIMVMINMTKDRPNQKNKSKVPVFDIYRDCIETSAAFS